MNKITLVGLNAQKEAVFESLMQLGVVEIVDYTKSDDSNEWEEFAEKDGSESELIRTETQISEVASALECLSRYYSEKKGLFASKKTISAEDYSKIIGDSIEINAIVKQIRSYEEKLISFRTEENRLKTLETSLEAWKGFDADIEKKATAKTATAIGVIPSVVDIEEFEKTFQQELEYGYLEVINSDKDQHYIFTMIHNECEQKAIELLKQKAYSQVSFKDIKGTVQENLQLLEVKISHIKKQREEFEQKISDLGKYKNQIEIFYDSLLMLKDRKAALKSIIKTSKAFMLKGWLPQSASEAIKTHLSNTYECMVEIEEPLEDEEIPILLENNKVAEAMEPITQMYSLPNYKEIDPNIVTIPFFVIFFGLMLSDAGYGLILAAFTGIVLWRFDLEEGTKKFMKLMFFCGLSTVFWGAMFGGWFGNVIPLLDETITGKAAGQSTLFGPLWFNPIDQTERMLRYALIFGVIHLYAGLAIRGINLIKRKKYIDVVFDVFFWYVFFTGFALYVLPYVPGVDALQVAGIVELGKYLLLAGAVLLILTQGREKKGFFGKLFGGISSLYNIIGFMSDTLSYSRLLALGIATSIIATIVNQMGSMVGLNKIHGIILFVIVFIGGHMFNFAINALGAYVHSSRLQYIEFFSKFYNGGGVAFKPLKQNTRYIKIKN